MLQLRHKNSNKGALWLVEPKYSIGSGANCDIQVEGSQILQNHARLEVNNDSVTLFNEGNGGVSVNSEIVNGSMGLHSGDLIMIGNSELVLTDPKAEAVKAQAQVASPVANQQGWSLKALSAAMSDHTYPLTGVSVIGRSKDCDISLSVVHLSRRHAQLKVSPEGLSIKDLDSSNGTFVNGKRVNETQLKSGDEISFDNLRFRVVGPEESENQTILRQPQTDDNLTTVRPAIGRNQFQQKPAGQRPGAGHAKAHHGAKPERAQSRSDAARDEIKAQISQSQMPQKSSDSSSIVGWVVLGVLLVGVLGYTLYSGLIPLG